MPDEIKVKQFQQKISSPEKLWIKICGITTIEDARKAVLAGADAIGFVLWKGSVRYIPPHKARKCKKALSQSNVLSVGVFMESSAEDIISVANTAALDAIQCHWAISKDLSLRLKELGYGLISVFNEEQSYHKEVDAWIADSIDKEGAGGTGQLCNWQSLKSLSQKVNLILAGGLNTENISQAIEEVHPNGVDVSTGVSCKDRRRKDFQLMCTFVQNARDAHARLLKEV